MEENFRNTLIILSAVIIGAIFVHGLWTIRKAKNPYKLKTSKHKIEPMSRGFDSGGFDQDGVGKAKVTGSTEENSQSEDMLVENKRDNSNEDKALELDDEVTLLNENGQENTVVELKLSSDSLSESEFANPSGSSADDEPSVEEAQEVNVYQTPITHAKPEIKTPRKAIKLPKKPSKSKAELKRNQIEINFGDINTTDMNLDDEIRIKDNSTPSNANSLSNDNQTAIMSPAPEPQVIALSVVMPENQFMAGASLLPCLLTMGMKYGDMNIFHRHQDNAGNGDITFSLANMMKPGTFDLDSMETFATQGVSLFMTLPNAGNPFKVYEQMLAAAKNLAQEFNGKVHDDKRNALTKQSEQHYLSIIREFDRKSRIAAVE